MMKQDILERLQALRERMAGTGIDAVVIPQTDPHQSEYIADHWQARRWLSGFTGSAGSLVVTADKAALWADSRYWLQAAEQLSGTSIEEMKEGQPGTPSIIEFLASTLKPGMKVGVDGMLFSRTQAAAMRRQLAEHGIEFSTEFDPIDAIWTDRPPLPADKIFVHDEMYAGQPAKDKIGAALAKAREARAEAVFITPLDEIAWTLNIRCSDVKYNPVATAYLYIGPDKTVLLTDPAKTSPELLAYLASQGVEVAPYDSVKDFIAQLPPVKVLAEEARIASTLDSLLGDRAVYGPSPIAVPKGCKNPTQIIGVRQAMKRDGAALVKVLMEIERALSAGESITELDVEAMLRKRRSEQPLFFDESFGSIVGYEPHGAIVHYEPSEESNVEIKPEGLLLIDSGAQYLDGTTDITRTIALGEPTELEKRDFTLVLKGHIALAKAVFPVGTLGAQLDALARQYLWQNGLSYLHGTGHGVGHFLNVHEGPQSIRLNYTPTPLMPGMITSNEPGLYREGVHGIRCENLVLTEHAMTTEFGEFLKFETLTLFPFDTRLIDQSIFTADEAAWLNDYHKHVQLELTPMLNAEEQAWLNEKTKEIQIH